MEICKPSIICVWLEMQEFSGKIGNEEESFPAIMFDVQSFIERMHKHIIVFYLEFEHQEQFVVLHENR